jgi:hypothetical protein
MVLQRPICNSADCAGQPDRFSGFSGLPFTVLQMLPQPLALDKLYVNGAAPASFNTGMKSFVAAFALLGMAAAAAMAGAPPPPQRAAPVGHGVRQAVQEFVRQEVNAPPRQLTESERAELRRQLNEYGRQPARRP